jgi:hypothetical protein
LLLLLLSWLPSFEAWVFWREHDGGEEVIEELVVVVNGEEAKKLSVEAENVDGEEILDRLEPEYEDVMMD